MDYAQPYPGLSANPGGDFAQRDLPADHPGAQPGDYLRPGPDARPADHWRPGPDARPEDY
jgi:hypothetical protein